MAGGHSLNVRQGPGPHNPRQPIRIREGQRFFPLRGKRRLLFTVKRVEGEWARVLREDGSEGKIAVDRLLACDAEGNGAHYRFHGWRDRPRGYRTELVVRGIFPDEGRCTVVLPEWDPSIEVEQSLGILHEELRKTGAEGSCMANLASASAAGLAIHSCRTYKVRDARRPTTGAYPDVLAKGQRFRLRTDATRVYRLQDDGFPRVHAWNGRRLVWLSAERLLAVRSNGEGRFYEYLGGGVREARHKRGNGA